jgi:ribosomal protein S18 acetylase RimI-like enzyme
MIINTVNLSNKQTFEINNLITICEEYDNANMCIQIDHTLNLIKDLKSWILYYYNGELIGLLSIFSPMINEAEISICVNPKYRNEGISKKLFKIMYENLNEFNIENILYVCDRNSKDGIAILKNKGLNIHHTEYIMKYINNENKINEKNIIVKIAGENDIETMVYILMNAFETTFESAKCFVENSMKSENKKGFIGIKDNKNIGIAFVGYNESISINTVGIIKEEQNKRYGKELINTIIETLKLLNKEIIIDVDSSNINACKLYKGIGFEEKTIIDYYQK